MAAPAVRRDGGLDPDARKEVDGIPCFHGLATTDVPGEDLLEVALDVAGSIQWSSAGVKEAATLASDGRTVDYYQYLDVPGWTLSADRFWFLRATIERSDGQIVMSWSRLEDGGPYASRFAEVRDAYPRPSSPR